MNLMTLIYDYGVLALSCIFLRNLYVLRLSSFQSAWKIPVDVSTRNMCSHDSLTMRDWMSEWHLFNINITVSVFVSCGKLLCQPDWHVHRSTLWCTNTNVLDAC